jgi:5-methylcytosine-specific restriction protein A
MFEKGKYYHRVNDIHKKYGGKRQSGIANCPNYPYIFIFSGGNKGKESGYKDCIEGKNFYYTGEGSRGDMEFTAGNRSLRDHHVNEKQVFLFMKTEKSGYWKYVGELKYTSYKMDRGKDIEGKARDIIMFKFVML